MLLFNEYQSKESLANLKRLYAMAKNCPFCGHTQKDKVLIYCENQEYEPAYTNRYIIQVKRGKE